MTEAPRIFVDRYEVVDTLGQGGFATVFLAKDLKLPRNVAVKVLDENLAAKNPTMLKRFEREAHTVAQLSHPHIIHIYDSGQEQGRFFIVVPYLPGGDLASRLKQQGALPTEQVLRITEQVGAALDYAHQRDIIHRDIKPANVMFDEQGQAILTDFGIVKVTDENTALTQTGMTMGTLFYMAPEVWTTGQVDHRADLYALGIMVYQMLTGAVPFTGTTPPQIMYAHLNLTPPPLHQLNPTLSPAVDEVLAKMLEKAPADRYQTAGQFYADLRRALLGELDRTILSPIREDPPPRKIPKIAWLGGLGLLAVLIVGGLLWFTTGGDSTPSTAAPAFSEAQVELDGQVVTDNFQQVTCGKSHRLEVKLLDSDNAPLEPTLFAYSWRFEPDDAYNEDKTNSGNYAANYQVPCELTNQTVTIEAQKDGKTFFTKSLLFDISQ